MIQIAKAQATFADHALWQLSAAEEASVALQKAQASQVYAGLEQIAIGLNHLIA